MADKKDGAKRAAVFLIDGFEEVEALSSVDILRRGGVDVTTVSLMSGRDVESKHAVIMRADALFADAAGADFDMLVIPGGTTAYMDHDGLVELVKKYSAEGKFISAICAAPSVLGKAGIIKGRRAVCYPGMENFIEGAVLCNDFVVTDGHITTGKGPAAAPFFALRLLELLTDSKTAGEVAGGFLLNEITETHRG